MTDKGNIFTLFVSVFAFLIVYFILSGMVESEFRGREEGEGDWKKVMLAAIPMSVLFLLTFDLFSYELNISGIGIILFILIVFCYPPAVLLTDQLRKLFEKENKGIFLDFTTILLGLIYTVLLVEYSMDLYGVDYYKPVYAGQYHNILHSEYGGIIWIILLISAAALLILSGVAPRRMPPLVSALAIGFTLTGLIITLLIYIQMMKNFTLELSMIWVYFAALLAMSVRSIRNHIEEQVRKANETERVFNSRAGEKLHKLMTKISSMTLISFGMIFPIAAVIEMIYILKGQGADGFIKAFTETADWTFSQQTPPPPLEYDGHYLCTVAAGGHKNIVKPLRYGKRRGTVIVVNRQLLAANAFEDLIMERLPGFHKAVRSFYDKHGYPLSKLIITQLRADIVYYLMKPLEYIFVLVLYLFDTEPENRIAVQYSEYKRPVKNRTQKRN